MSDIYTTKTAALRASKASIRKLDTKSVTINGKKVNPDEYAILNEENTFSANNIFEGDISIENSSIIFNGDSDVIPENSVTNEAKLAAESAAASAEVCAASEQIVIEKTEIASAAATSAETSATEAAASAELLGDAALKSQNNTFTGKNVFNGAVSGSGTLFGWDFARMEGLISMLQGIQFKKEEFTKIFPNHKEMEVWPGLDNPLESMSSDVLPKLKYVYMYLKKGYYVGVPDLSSSSLKDLCIRCDINTQFVYLNLRAEKNLLWLPAYVGTLQSPLELSPTHNSWRPNVIIYAPKMLALRLKQHWSGSLGYDVAFIGAQVYKRLQCYNDAAYKDMPVTLHGFNSSSCVEVSLQNLGLDKASILELVNGLSAYDATTMTAVPTCALYVRPEYEGDEEIVNALLNLQTSVEEGGKGWTVAVSGISLTESATFSLRSSLYCKKLQDDNGRYVDSDGNRWDVSSGTIVLRHGIANEELGYEPFENLESALETWGLTEYVDPRVKEMTEEFNN